MKRIIDWFRNLFPKSEDKNDPQESHRMLLRNVVIKSLFLTIGIAVMLYCFMQKNALAVVLTFLMVAAACFVVGGTIGFLFGMPKSKVVLIKQDADDKNTPNQEQNPYEDNTNLQELSDWITKLIVGLSLIKLNTILAWLDNASDSIASAYKTNCFVFCAEFNFYVFAYCAIVFYFLLGAGMLYLWARIDFMALLSLQRKQKKLQEENKELIGTVQNLANNTAAVPTDPAAVPDVPGVPPNVQNLDLVPRDEERFSTTSPSERDDNFRSLIKTIYNSKNTFFKDDLQKGRWGGRSKVGNILLEGTYNESIGALTGIYNISLRVRSLDPAKPVEGEVAFFLHDTFRNPIQFAVSQNNLAEIRVNAWQAFVVGARLKDGTELELDLNTVKGFPNKFYWK